MKGSTRRIILGLGAALLVGGWGLMRYAHEQQTVGAYWSQDRWKTETVPDLEGIAAEERRRAERKAEFAAEQAAWRDADPETRGEQPGRWGLLDPAVTAAEAVPPIEVRTLVYRAARPYFVAGVVLMAVGAGLVGAAVLPLRKDKP